MEFIYLGKASFKQEMLTEFLSVARSLEIMELINAEPSNDEIVTNCKLKPATNLVTSDEEVVAPEFL